MTRPNPSWLTSVLTHVADHKINRIRENMCQEQSQRTHTREDVELFVIEQQNNGFADETVSEHQTVDGGHGRIETHKTQVIQDSSWLQKQHNWPELKAVVMVESTWEIDSKIQQETRFYITSAQLRAEEFGKAVRRSLGH